MFNAEDDSNKDWSHYDHFVQVIDKLRESTKKKQQKQQQKQQQQQQQQENSPLLLGRRRSFGSCASKNTYVRLAAAWWYFVCFFTNEIFSPSIWSGFNCVAASHENTGRVWWQRAKKMSKNKEIFIFNIEHVQDKFKWSMFLPANSRSKTTRRCSCSKFKKFYLAAWNQFFA